MTTEPVGEPALEESIAHWKRIRDGSSEGISGCECALCRKYYLEQSSLYDCEPCMGCPVKERTGFAHCEGSPYDDVSAARAAYGRGSPEFLAAAAKEVEFLESLRPARDEAGEGG